MKSAVHMASAAVVLSLAGCSEHNRGSNGEAYTYWQDVKPIMDAKCGDCHAAGGIGSVSLETYEEIFEYRGLIELAVSSGIMPPWPPDPGCNEFRHDRSLSDDQRATLLTWIEQGALEGDPANPGDPIPTSDPDLPRVDASLSMNQAYEPPLGPEETDEYRCFLLEWPFDEREYVTGFEIHPGNESIVHHAEAHIALPGDLDEYEALEAEDPGPGYSCFGGVKGPEGGALGGWAPGHPGLLFPDGSGVRVEPGSKIVLQVHYHATAAQPGSDQTSFDVMVEDSVDREGFFMPWLDPQWVEGEMPIPAGDADVAHRFTWEATSALSSLLPIQVSSFEIWSAQLHLHYLGTQASLSVQRSTGGDVCLLDLPVWDRDWQADYFFEDSVRVEQGDAITIECRWDNSADNQPVIDGERPEPRDVNWGWGSRDEMCVGFFYVTL